MEAADINTSIDSNPGSSFDLVRIADDVDQATAGLIAEGGDGSSWRRGRRRGAPALHRWPSDVAVLGYTGPVSAEQLADLRAKGYLPDDLIGKTGLEATYETELRGVYGSESIERDASGRRIQVLQTLGRPDPVTPSG